MVRLFAGLQIPEVQRQQVALLKSPLPGAFWIEPENYHLTLRFAGDIDNAQAADFADALEGLEAEAFSARLSGLGTFGGKDPRSLWVGVEGGEALEALARGCERAAREAGLAADARAFKPHVTIARLRNVRVDALARFLQHHGAFRLPAFPVEEFVLFSSRPRVGGGPYVVEVSFPLRHAGEPESLAGLDPDR
jgi:2'-5' RNA ligase